jgi:putative membrane protein
MLWIKSLHIVFMVTWFAGLFYLPRLFVYHALATDAIGIERFKLMERKLYYGIMAPGAILTIIFGMWLWLGYGITGGWLYAKLALVAILIAHHLWLGKLMRDFRRRPQSPWRRVLSLDQRDPRCRRWSASCFSSSSNPSRH